MESYLVTVTDVSGTNTSLSGTYNTFQCLPITSDLSPDVCGPFMASVVAVNGIGTSNITVHKIKTESNFSSDSLPCFQIRGLCTHNGNEVDNSVYACTVQVHHGFVVLIH